MPSKYTLEITDLPENVKDEEELIDFFENNLRVQIYDCNIARNYQDTLFENQELANLVFKLKVEISRLERKKQKDSELSKKLTK
jgi:hypothetical protein